MLLSAATTEIWGGANLAFGMCPEMAVGAIVVLRKHASPQLQAEYLEPLASGRWTAAMSLTEPQAGSDLSTLRTLAQPSGERWLLRGRKIFISWGDHDLTDNIVHLVLARTPDAPPGARGLSLFLVPKRLRDGDGWRDNDIHAVSLEHKMGIRASPTCVMVLGDQVGACGWLVGERHQGLACMFTLMNHMRLGVGLQSTGLAERARQLALGYAAERVQGRDAGGKQCPIIEHADVRRMLMTMNALTHAARCLAYSGAAALDLVHAEDTAPATRARAERRLGLLTPLVKAWCSEVAVEVSSLGVQVHGGMGFMEECEASQVYRDARIGPIFEGTNYIQSQDLLLRKIARDQGAALVELLQDMQRAALALPDGHSLRTALPAHCERLQRSVAALTARFGALSSAADAQAMLDLAGGVAVPLLHWLGVLAGAWQWALSVNRVAGETSEFAQAVRDHADFYAAHVLPRVFGLAAIVESGGEAVIQRAKPAALAP
jgi:alkylation response protein AidB-like acyl-CoA dehydrogenase